MDEFIVQLLTKLDTSQVIKDYNDLKQQLEKQINIKVNLDFSSKNDISKLAEQLQTALSKVSNGKLNLDTSQIITALEQVTKNSQQTGQRISSVSNSTTTTVIQNERKKQQAFQETEKEYQKIAKDKSLVRDDSDFKQVFGTVSSEAKEAQKHFKKLLEDEKAIVTVNEKFNDSNALQSFVINIKRANGEVESLRYAMENLEQYTGKTNDWHLAYQGGSVNDANAIKQFEQLERKATEFSNKLNDLKSKLTGTNFNFSSFENTLSQFRNGEITVNQLSTAFNQLKNVAESSLKGLNSQSSSFNPIQQTLNNMRDLPSMMTSLETNMKSLKDKTSLTNVSVQDLVSTYNSLKAEMDAVGGTVPLTDEWTAKYRELMSTVTALTEQVKTLKKVEASDNSAVKLANQTNKIQLSIETSGYESKVKSLITKTQQWTDENGNARISTDALSTALKNLGTASIALSNNNTVENQKALIAAEKELDTQLKTVTNSVKLMNAEYMKSSAVDNLRQKVQQFYDLNGKAHLKWGSDLKRIMNELGQGMEVPIARGKALEQEFIQIQNAARQAGKLGKTWFQTLRDGMSSFSYWTSSTFLVMKAIQSVKSGISTVKALDTALVDLKKTTTMTASELEDFYYASNKVAKQMGVTTEEIINQAAEFSRLGYSSKEAATQMAKYSSWFKTISPGMSIEQAGDTLTSVMKAFKYDVQDVEKIMSMINTVGNNFAVSNLDISEILTRSSSAMMEANNTLADTIALGTAATEITRDAASVGNALKTKFCLYVQKCAYRKYLIAGNA